MDDIVYWVYLQRALGFASRRLYAALDAFGSARAFCEASAERLAACGLFTEHQLSRIRETRLDACVKTVEKCAELGYDMITPDCGRYPVGLSHIPDPPAVLYVSGSLGDWDDTPSVSVVGTRHCTRQGYAAAYELSARISHAGAAVVSGGALGIDTAALKGALRGGGIPVAVLGCGLDYPYLHENESLRRAVAERGALVSEFPPGYPSAPQNFPMRNRIMAGLSLGVIVAQAGERSGALITARHALERGRDVFVLPGDVCDPHYAGANLLLRDGAKPVLSPADVLEEYAAHYPHRLDLRGSELPLGRAAVNAAPEEAPPQMVASPRGKPPAGRDEHKSQKPQSPKELPVGRDEHKSQKPQSPEEPPVGHIEPELQPTQSPNLKKSERPAGLTEPAAALYEAITASVTDADELIAASGLAQGEALAALTELEILGILAALPGGRYAFCLNNDNNKE